MHTPALSPRRILLAVALLLTPAVPSAVAAPETWAKDIDALTAQDATQAPAPGGVVFVGSSSIRLWKTLAQDFPGIPTLNRGFGGSELADSVFYEDRLVLPYQPRLVVLFAGTNDLWRGEKMPEGVLADFQAFRTKLHAALPKARLIYIAITLAPSRARIHEQMRATNRLIAADCNTDPRCTFVDINPSMSPPGGTPPADLFVEDQLHLNASGYAIWARVLAPYLKP